VREVILLEDKKDWKLKEDEVALKKDELRKRPVLKENQDETFRKKVKEEMKRRVEEMT
jgi:hypothetical protein